MVATHSATVVATPKEERQQAPRLQLLERRVLPDVNGVEAPDSGNCSLKVSSACGCLQCFTLLSFKAGAVCSRCFCDVGSGSPGLPIDS